MTNKKAASPAKTKLQSRIKKLQEKAIAIKEEIKHLRDSLKESIAHITGETPAVKKITKNAPKKIAAKAGKATKTTKAAKTTKPVKKIKAAVEVDASRGRGRPRKTAAAGSEKKDEAGP